MLRISDYNILILILMRYMYGIPWWWLSFIENLTEHICNNAPSTQALWIWLLLSKCPLIIKSLLLSHNSRCYEQVDNENLEINNVAIRRFKNRETRNEAYQSIAFRKRKPLLKERLDEDDVRLEGQRRYLWKLQQFDLQWSRIGNDLHAHLKTTPYRISHSQTKS